MEIWDIFLTRACLLERNISPFFHWFIHENPRPVTKSLLFIE